ncbi:AfsR/SARP family transcriptional regulator, partial [Streptomyces sp. NPDC002920]
MRAETPGRAEVLGCAEVLGSVRGEGPGVEARRLVQVEVSGMEALGPVAAEGPGVEVSGSVRGAEPLGCAEVRGSVQAEVSGMEALGPVGAEALRFQVLGPVRVWRDGVELDLGFPQQRALLALLLACAGRPVPTGEILDVLWAERPPASAVHVTRRYAGALRRLLEPGLPPRAPGRRLLRRTGGYLLAAETDEVDLLRFRELTRRGSRAAATGRPDTAAGHFARALA